MDSYRLEILVTDIIFKLLIAAVLYAAMQLALKTHATKDRWYSLWIPVLTTTCLGLITMAQTIIKRLGAWLASQGDLWEIALAGHGPTKYLMISANALIFVPFMGALLVYAQRQAWGYFGKSRRYCFWAYLLASLILTAAGLYFVVLAAQDAGKGFTK